MNPFSQLINRIWKYVGPRQLPEGTSVYDGLNRQLSPIPQSITRWQFHDVEDAIHDADQGLLKRAGQLCRALRSDGVLAGVLSTRMEGLVQLPRFIDGDDPAINAQLEREFDYAFPAPELALMMGDGRLLGVMLGEFVEAVPGYPILTRRDPEFLQYRASDDRWYYQSRINGLIPIDPGDGRWVLYTPGGTDQPWHQALWKGLAKSYVSKDHATMFREAWNNGLANPAKIGITTPGTTDEDRATFLRQISEWSLNAGFALPPGYDLKLLESNGLGFKTFQETIDTADRHIKLAISGETVTGDGGAGFSNSAIHASIRSDLIQSDGNALAAMLNTQAIYVWVNTRFGWGAVSSTPRVRWDTTPPKDRMAEATAANQMAIAAKAWNEVLAASSTGQTLDLVAMAKDLGLPMMPAPIAPAVDSGASESQTAAIPLMRRRSVAA